MKSSKSSASSLKKASAKAKPRPKAVQSKTTSKLASIKNAILGFGSTPKKKAGPGPKAAVKADSKAKHADVKMKGGAAPSPAAKIAATSKNGSGAPMVANGAHGVHGANGKSKIKSGKSVAAGIQARGRAASQALSQIATAKSGKTASAESDSVCREVACEGLATSGGYCRLHYIKNWKKVQRKAQILREGKLNQYIEELVAKYPDKYIDAIRQDLANDKDFAKVIYDLDLDESTDEFTEVEGESADSLIDNIKREFDDEGESF